MKVALIPSSVKEFKCIGATCEDHCCQSWNIDIDKLNYLKVKGSANPEIKAISKDAYKKKMGTTSNDRYANIVFDDQNTCSFLDENKLCKIHKLLGESYLCDTCSIYPKVYKKVGDFIEKSLLLSCPEATRVIINNSNGIEFEESYLVQNERAKLTGSVTTDKSNIMWEIRVFTISVLQQKGFTLDEKMKVIGLLSEMLKNKDLTLQLVQATIQSIIQKIENGSVQHLLQKSTNVELQFRFYKESLCVLAEELSINKRLIDTINEFIIGFGTGPLAVPTLTVEELNKFIEVESKYQNYMEHNSHILENYLVHYVYTFNFPFNKPTVFDGFLEMYLNYQIITALFKGSIAYNDELLLNNVVKIIQSFSKATGHNPYGLELLRSRLSENNYNNLSFLYSII